MTATATEVTSGEVVVLLADDGTPLGTAPKATVHTANTPLHLAFSCYLFDSQDRLLLTQRALDKSTFPGLWTNSACGHPEPGERGSQAAVRRVRDELGAQIYPPRLVLPEFRYQATMGGLQEHEWCPVYVGRVADGLSLAPDATEVEATCWMAWTEVIERAFDPGSDLSPWCIDQIRQLNALGSTPDAWPDGDPARLPLALQFDGTAH